MCVFLTFFAVFHDLLFGCLHKQSISIKNVLSSGVVTLHSVVGNGHISPFLGNDQVQVSITSFMILFYSKKLHNK